MKRRDLCVMLVVAFVLAGFVLSAAGQEEPIVVDSDEPQVTVQLESGRQVDLNCKAAMDETVWILIRSSKYFPDFQFARPETEYCEQSGRYAFLFSKAGRPVPGADDLYYSTLCQTSKIPFGLNRFDGLGDVTIATKRGQTAGDLEDIQTISLLAPQDEDEDSAIIVDHTCTDLSQIPDRWLERAKELTLHYAHTSHGSQVISGIENLESLNPLYAVAVRESGSEGLPPQETPPVLRIYDGNPPETYIMPEDYWDGEDGLDRTRAVADTGSYNYSMWSWCGQVSDASFVYIQSYLEALDTLESQYPAMRFIYMTGHLDGTGSDGNLHARNEQIRRYCRENNKVLFDFADIERFDPEGNDYLDLGANDNCDYSGGNWAEEWCGAHPGSDLCAPCSCAHSQALNCNLKARAFWWMMARLAGWER